jgi:hypothetical protein
MPAGRRQDRMQRLAPLVRVEMPDLDLPKRGSTSKMARLCPARSA